MTAGAPLVPSAPSGAGHQPGEDRLDGSPDRHPAARAGAAPLRRAVNRSAHRLPGIDGPHRTVAAAVLAIRGGERRTAEAFAAAYGLTEAELEAIEAGRVPVDQVPTPLRVLTPLDELAR